MSVQPITSGSQGADSFGRQRFSAPTSIFQLLYQYDTQPLFQQYANVGTGFTIKTPNESSLTLSTGGTAAGAQALAQTKEYFAYEPGKSQQVLISGVLGTQKSNVQSRLGYFDANNGCFFEMDGTNGPSVVLRSNVGGSIIETRVKQTSWNVDRIDGTGISGVTADFSKAQVYSIDFQWLGAGRIRFGLFVGGNYVFCHAMPLGNTLVGPYMNTACLPVRGEITNTGVAASATTMKKICISVVSEGGQEKPVLLNFGASSGVAGVSVAARRPILSIRPKLLFAGQTNRGRIFLSDLVALSQGSGGSHPPMYEPVLYEIIYNGTLTGASFSSVDPNSLVEKDTSATAISGGTTYKTGYLASDQITPIDPVCRYPFTLDITGTKQDIITLVITPFAAIQPAPAVTGSFTWEELR